MHDHKYGDACPKLAESLRLDPGIGTMLWLADCFEKSGRIASAWAEFREAAESAALAHDDREKVARDRAVKLQPRLPQLTIVVASEAQVEGLVVKRDGSAVDKPLWGTDIPVDPGTHVVDVSAPGKKPWQRTLSVEEAHAISVKVPVLDDAPPSALTGDGQGGTSASGAGPQGGEVPPPPAGTGTMQRTLGIVIGGLGVVGVGLGAYFGFAAKSKLDDSNANGNCTPDNFCNPTGTQARNDAKTDASISTVAFIAGGVALAGGLALFFTAPHGQKPVSVSATAAPGGGGLVLRGAF